MAFRVKNLMIRVLPAERDTAAKPAEFCKVPTCLLGTCKLGTCRLGTCKYGTCMMGTCAMGTCKYGTCAMGTCKYGSCPMGTCMQPTYYPCRATTLPDDWGPGAECFASDEPIDLGQLTPVIEEGGLEELTELEGQLKELSTAVAAKLKEHVEAAKPKTVAEAEALEKHLDEALAEIRAHKEALKKRAGGGG